MFTTDPSNRYSNITLALAGVFQAARLVNDLAMTGACDDAAFTTSIKSIYKIDADDVPSIYGGKENLILGLREIEAVFVRRKQKADPNISRYALSLILLQHKLAHNKTMLVEIQKRIKQVINQVSYFSATHDTVIANLADIYLSSISTFRFRIQITGKTKNLHNEILLNKIRALFLAGIRSAVLWHQMGGRRWQLFLARPILLRAARENIEKMK